MIEEEQKKIILSNKNVTQEELPYTVFNKHKNISRIKANKEGAPQWTINMTSVGYGNYSQMATIDPEFTYLQIDTKQFDATLKQKLVDVGFKKKV